MNNSLAFSYKTRETKKGIVYDVIFRIDDPSGKTMQKRLCGYPTKSSAKAAYIEFMRTYIDPSKRDKEPILYSKAILLYQDYLKTTTKESTQYDFEHIKVKYLDYYLHGDMHKWTQKDIYYFIDQLWSKPFKQKYLTKIYGFFSSFYNWARTRFELDNILDGIKLPKKPEQKFKYTIWTEEDFNKFIACVDNQRYKTLFATLFYTGLRCGEMQSLMASDYDGNFIMVNKTYSRKTLDDSTFKITPSKNYKSRKVPVPNRIKPLLEDLRLSKTDDEYLFGSSTPLSSNAITNAFNKYKALSGVPNIRIHDLRHSYVSLLMSKGANFGVIAALIGDTLEQVVKTYAHTTEEDMIRFVTLL